MNSRHVMFAVGLTLVGISWCGFWLSTLNNIPQILLSIIGMGFGGILTWFGENQNVKQQKVNKVD